MKGELHNLIGKKIKIRFIMQNPNPDIMFLEKDIAQDKVYDQVKFMIEGTIVNVSENNRPIVLFLHPIQEEYQTMELNIDNFNFI